jgi:hypothetical protein
MANTMCDGIMQRTRKSVASIHQAAIGADTRYAKHAIKHYSVVQLGKDSSLPEVQYWPLQLAVVSGATLSQNALLLQQKHGAFDPQNNTWHLLEGQYDFGRHCFPSRH